MDRECLALLFVRSRPLRFHDVCMHRTTNRRKLNGLHGITHDGNEHWKMIKKKLKIEDLNGVIPVRKLLVAL